MKKSIFTTILFTIITSAKAHITLEVSNKNNLEFGINENGSFSAYTRFTVPQDIYVWINYTEGCNLNPLPNDTITNGTKVNLTYTVSAVKAGHTTVILHTTPAILDTKNAFVRVGVYKSYDWIVISTIIGVLYSICWSVSFYPQIFINFRRKSVVGLNFDFLGLNLTGFLAYSVYNVGFRFIREVQLEYHTINPTGVIPVEMTDVLFAVHATVVTIITIGQCFIYERGNQLISKSTVALLAAIWSTAAVFLLLTALDVIKQTPWLTFLYYFSYVKLVITLIKYVPQVHMNYKRKSTIGFSIVTVFFDFTGGLFSIAQMFIISYNYDDWYSLLGNFTKFGLGVTSIAFDVMFLVQHYILYRHPPPTSDKMDDPLII